MKKSELRKLVLEAMKGTTSQIQQEKKSTVNEFKEILSRIVKEELKKTSLQEGEAPMTKDELINRLKGLGNTQVTIPQIHPTGAYDKNADTTVTANRAVEELMYGDDAMFREKRPNSYEVIRSEEELKRHADAVRAMGGLDEEVYDLVHDIRRAIGSGSASDIEYYLGRELTSDEEYELRQAGVLKYIGDKSSGRNARYSRRRY